MLKSAANTTYDEIPYESASFEQTHPDRLATIGRLFGMNPKPVYACRVLELGCASGGNLIPMAFQLPQSEFVGADLSGRQVDMGLQVIKDLHLENIRLTCTSIMDVVPDWGKFDYIICHGVYSWVADEVRKKILSICSQNMAPNGIAYISYNTYPGWHMRGMIRSMMLFHTQQFDDTQERIEQARALIDFLARSVPTENNYFGLLLRSELNLIKSSRDSYLFHEHLEDTNEPVYFHQFMDQAVQYDLQYLGEANFATMLTSGFSQEVHETLNKISHSIINVEQYMDFLRNRQFRQTLLCHKDHVLRRHLNDTSLTGLKVASAVYPAPTQVDMAPQIKHTFQAPNGATISTGSSLTKSALLVLRECWPCAVSLESLIQKAVAKLNTDHIDISQEMNQAKRILGDDLLFSYTANAVEFHTWQAGFARQADEYPTCNALVRYQIEHDLPVVNQRHEYVRLDFFSKELLKLMDGKHNHEHLLAALIHLTEQGKLVLKQKENSLLNASQVKDTLTAMMQKALPKLARLALLVGG